MDRDIAISPRIIRPTLDKTQLHIQMFPPSKQDCFQSHAMLPAKQEKEMLMCLVWESIRTLCESIHTQVNSWHKCRQETNNKICLAQRVDILGKAVFLLQASHTGSRLRQGRKFNKQNSMCLSNLGKHGYVFIRENTHMFPVICTA